MGQTIDHLEKRPCHPYKTNWACNAIPLVIFYYSKWQALYPGMTQTSLVKLRLVTGASPSIQDLTVCIYYSMQAYF